jgi:hypothetical protein
MTRDEVRDLLNAIPQNLTADEFIMAVVNAAAEWERRACAKVVETHPGDKESLLQAAAKIRNRT